LFKTKEIEFYSFQKGFGIEQLKELPEEYSVIDVGSTFENFTDTAAALENIDILITIDTAIAHLAGAMQKEVWLMLPFVPEWRWGLSGLTTHWYKSFKLFRQKSLGNWDSVVSDVKMELQKDKRTIFRQSA
jgi:hypothetical protein